MATLILNAAKVAAAVEATIKRKTPPPNSYHSGWERERGLLNEISDAANWMVRNYGDAGQVGLTFYQLGMIHEDFEVN